MKSQLRKAVVRTLRAAFRAGGMRSSRLAGEAMAAEGEYLPLSIQSAPTASGAIRFFCLGDTSAWRVATLYSKEPETIEWIDTFAENDVLWDIGANIGLYSLYAAVARKAKVLAFEPAAANYALINRNIELNGLDGAVTAYCLAFSDAKRLNELNMQNSGFGEAGSSFGTAVDDTGAMFTPKFRQGMLGYSVDRFIDEFDPPFPNHIKIDVDGIEDRIIDGARRTLADARLRTVSIELDASRPDHTDAIIARIAEGGVRFVGKRHGPMFETGRYAHIYNYLFQRPTT
jgi:FkbM family methyltransferase